MSRLLVAVFLLATLAFGQTRKEFEVASIRPVEEQLGNQVALSMTMNGAQARLRYFSLKDYIGLAYRVKVNQIVGPDWLGSSRFDILATLPEGTVQADINEMLQNLLADRFKLKLHREMRELSVYALEVGRNGFKLSPTGAPEPDDSTPLNVAAAGRGGSNAGVSIRFSDDSYFALGDKGFEAKNLTMQRVADLLTRFTDRPVIDMTNAKGTYNLNIELSQEDRTVMLVRSAVAAGVPLPPQALALLDNASIAPLNNGLEQAGLALNARKTPLEVLVIDSMEKTPTEN